MPVSSSAGDAARRANGARGTAMPLKKLRAVVAAHPAAAIFFAVLALYAVSVPHNQSEAEDSYWYAYDVRSKPVAELLHPHHLLYLPAARLLYRIGLFGDAFEMMLWINVVLGAATVAITWKILRNVLQLGPQSSLAGVALLGASYGFWRYSVAVEIYIPVLAAHALLCIVAFGRGEGWRAAAGAALLASLAIFIHAPLSVPLTMAAIPVFFALERRWRDLLVYGAIATALISIGFVAAFRFHAHADAASVSFVEFVRGPAGELRPPLSLDAVPKAVVAFGSTIVSGNFLFPIRPALESMRRLMPYRNLTEEEFTAEAYSEALAWAGLASVAALLAAGIACLRQISFSARGCRALITDAPTAAVLTWMVTSLLLVVATAPENPELWICSILPLAITAAVMLDRFWRGLRFRALFTLLALLCVHNGLFGLAVIRPKSSDYNRAKASWVLQHTGKDDTIVTRDNDVFTRYLRYHSRAKVVNCWSADAAETRKLLEEASRSASSVFVFNDVLVPPAYLSARYPTMTEGLSQLELEFADRLTPTGDPRVQKLEEK